MSVNEPEYTPTTSEVCEAYAWWHSEQQDGSPGIPAQESEAAFKRWLAAHDAEVIERHRARPIQASDLTPELARSVVALMFDITTQRYGGHARFTAGEQSMTVRVGDASGPLRLDGITRVAVVHPQRRLVLDTETTAFSGVELHVQDDGRTLKVLPPAPEQS